MTDKYFRELTEEMLRADLEKIAQNYMYVYDIYYSKGQPRDSAFIKDLEGVIKNASIILEVYVRDSGIIPSYALEKYKNMSRIIDSSIRYFENKDE